MKDGPIDLDFVAVFCERLQSARIGRKRKDYVDSYQVGHLNEALEARVTLDVDLVELDAITPRLSWLQQVLDLVAVDIYRQDGVLRLPHELLAQMGTDEAAGSDHADLQSGDDIAIQVQSRCHYVRMGLTM